MKPFGAQPRITNGRKRDGFNRQATAWIHYDVPDAKETAAHLKFPLPMDRGRDASGSAWERSHQRDARNHLLPVCRWRSKAAIKPKRGFKLWLSFLRALKIA